MICKCGSNTFIRCTPARGVLRENIVFTNGREDMEKSSSWIEGLVYDKPPKTMRCENCNQRYLNPDVTS